MRSYPLDAGTDAGPAYLSNDMDVYPGDNVTLIDSDTNPNFKTPDEGQGNSVRPVVEWDCVLYTCATQDECDATPMPDSPPDNGCDVRKFPSCKDNACG